MTTFYLVRHGETMWNKEHRLQGWLDSPLTEVGVLHAEKLQEYLKKIYLLLQHLVVQVVGQWRRCIYLLVIASSQFFYENDLREIYLGDWQGKTMEDILKTHCSEYELYTNYPAQFVATHTESFGAVTERAMFTLKKIAEKYPQDNVLIVSHAVTIKCMINAILERSIDQLWAEPFINGTSVTIVEHLEQQWHVKEIGTIYHLQ